MKKDIITIANNGRQTYQTPAIWEQDLQLEQTLFAASNKELLDIVNEEEEEWPVNPDTGNPYAPW